eukprot:3204585-Pyramimonas_sp.AAC.1
MEILSTPPSSTERRTAQTQARGLARASTARHHKAGALTPRATHGDSQPPPPPQRHSPTGPRRGRRQPPSATQGGRTPYLRVIVYD